MCLCTATRIGGVVADHGDELGQGDRFPFVLVLILILNLIRSRLGLRPERMHPLIYILNMSCHMCRHCLQSPLERKDSLQYLNPGCNGGWREVGHGLACTSDEAAVDKVRDDIVDVVFGMLPGDARPRKGAGHETVVDDNFVKKDGVGDGAISVVGLVRSSITKMTNECIHTA
jgi:hypothetical protein